MARSESTINARYGTSRNRTSHHHNAFLDAYSRASQIDDSMPPDTLSDSLTAGHHWIPRDAMDHIFQSIGIGAWLAAARS